MFDKSQKARVALTIYALLGVAAIGICFIVNFIHNEGVTWALYVLYAVPLLFLGMLPLCFRIKHNTIISLAILSVLTIPFLYLLDTIIPTSSWFVPLALPIAVKFLVVLWLCGVIIWKVKDNKWNIFLILLGVFGSFLTVTTINTINQYLGKTLPTLYVKISILSFMVTMAAIAIIAYICKLATSNKPAMDADFEVLK